MAKLKSRGLVLFTSNPDWLSESVAPNVSTLPHRTALVSCTPDLTLSIFQWQNIADDPVHSMITRVTLESEAIELNAIQGELLKVHHLAEAVEAIIIPTWRWLCANAQFQARCAHLKVTPAPNLSTWPLDISFEAAEQKLRPLLSIPVLLKGGEEDEEEKDDLYLRGVPMTLEELGDFEIFSRSLAIGIPECALNIKDGVPVTIP